MKVEDFIYKQIYNQARAEGARETAAVNAETIGLKKYKNNQFKKVIGLITQCVKDAKAGRV